jgi:hypothetical protein
MTKANEKATRYWQQHVEAFNSSGLTREAYSKKNGFLVYQLDYWGKKFERLKGTQTVAAGNQWMPVNICDDATEKESRIELWIGSVRIEVKRGFDSKLLAELIRTVGTEC